MNIVKMIFIVGNVPYTPQQKAGVRTYSYDTKEQLPVDAVYKSSAYPKNNLQVCECRPKTDTEMKQVLPYKVKELVIGSKPEIETTSNDIVYLQRID